MGIKLFTSEKEAMKEIAKIRLPAIPVLLITGWQNASGGDNFWIVECHTPGDSTPLYLCDDGLVKRKE